MSLQILYRMTDEVMLVPKTETNDFDLHLQT